MEVRKEVGTGGIAVRKRSGDGTSGFSQWHVVRTLTPGPNSAS